MNPTQRTYTVPATIAGRPFTVIGAGTLGRRIALMWLTRGGTVHLFDKSASALAAAQAQMPSKAPPPKYPPLTPSGRALSVGGRVRDISCDPLSPCFMYWPDNEALPDPSQIRPIDSALITVSTHPSSTLAVVVPR